MYCSRCRGNERCLHYLERLESSRAHREPAASAVGSASAFTATICSFIARHDQLMETQSRHGTALECNCRAFKACELQTIHTWPPRPGNPLVLNILEKISRTPEIPRENARYQLQQCLPLESVERSPSPYTGGRLLLLAEPANWFTTVDTIGRSRMFPMMGVCRNARMAIGMNGPKRFRKPNTCMGGGRWRLSHQERTSKGSASVDRARLGQRQENRDGLDGCRGTRSQP